MYSIFDIAAYFIQRSIFDRQYLNSEKLIKLCYFAHGYKLAIDGDDLVNERVQAWENGPVFVSLYQLLEVYKNKRFTKAPYFLSYEQDIIDHEDIEILDAVYESLIDMDSDEISNLSQSENSPWEKFLDKNNQPYTHIDNRKIKEYFENALNL